MRNKIIPHLENHHQDIHKFKNNFTTIDRKFDVIVEVIKLFRSQNPRLAAKIDSLLYPEGSKEA